MKYIMFVLLLCFCTFSVHGQHTVEFDIQYLTLNDSFLVNEIETLIKEQEHSDEKNNLFKKGLGYIKLDINRFSPDSDTLRSYTIRPGLNSMKKNDSDEFYPPFYSYVGDRIVLIYMKGFDMFSNLQFSNKSKRTLRNMLEPFLEKPKKGKSL